LRIHFVISAVAAHLTRPLLFFFFKQKTAYEF